MTTIVDAPAMRAPLTALSPTPPAPKITTVSPALTFAVFKTAPAPVTTPQPSRAAWANGSSLGTNASWFSWMRARSAKPPSPNPWNKPTRIGDGCFAAGTPLYYTLRDSKPIEQYKPGDAILSRAEDDPDGPVEIKLVKEVYVRFGCIMDLSVGGQVIKTTVEHPFYVRDKGWVKAIELERGDWLLSHEREWVMVQKIEDTGEYTTVYNLLVEDYHTYFVGSRESGISVWAHNYDNEFLAQLNIAPGSNPTARAVHEIYAQLVLTRPVATQRTFRLAAGPDTPRTPTGQLASRRLDGYVRATGTGFEAISNNWAQMTERQFDRKLEQIYRDVELLNRAQFGNNLPLQRIIWFGPGDLPPVGSQRRQLLDQAFARVTRPGASMQYYQVQVGQVWTGNPANPFTPLP
jgi:Pretoxin HINT domain